MLGRAPLFKARPWGPNLPFQLYEEGPWVLSSLLETAMAKAYSYLRFSTPEQMKGDSHRRQSTRAQEYAVRNHLDLDDKLTFHDLGVSGYRGKNSETGMLAEFLEAVRTGLVPRGSYLLVESLDRISRQAARKALRVLESICEEGITVVTLTDGRSYTVEILDTDPMALTMALLVFIRANEESASKSMRLKAAWSAKRAKADKKPLTSLAPSWLRLDKETGEFHVIPECAEVVRRIFREYLAGRGPALITTELNREGVPLFFRETKQGKRQATHWHRSYAGTTLSAQQSSGALSVSGTDVPFSNVCARMIRVELNEVSGTFQGVHAAGLAEVEVIARPEGP